MKKIKGRGKQEKRDHRNLKTSSVFMAAALLSGIAGFLLSNSLSLLAESLFVFNELLFLAMLLQKLNSKSVTTLAMLSSLVILLSGLYVLYAGSYRLAFGSAVEGQWMLVFALLGLLFSTLSISMAKKYYRFRKRPSLMPFLRKSLSSILVTAASVWIAFTGEVVVDHIFGMAIGLLVVSESVLLFRDASCLILGQKESETLLFRQ